LLFYVYLIVVVALTLGAVGLIWIPILGAFGRWLVDGLRRDRMGATLVLVGMILAVVAAVLVVECCLYEAAEYAVVGRGRGRGGWLGNPDDLKYWNAKVRVLWLLGSAAVAAVIVSGVWLRLRSRRQAAGYDSC